MQWINHKPPLRICVLFALFFYDFSDYLKPLDVDVDTLNKVVSFYKSVKKLARTSLMDGAGHLPTFSLRTLCRALNIAAGNPCQSAMRSLTEAFILCFLTEVDRQSYDAIFALILKKFGKGKGSKQANFLKQALPCPRENCINVSKVEKI